MKVTSVKRESPAGRAGVTRGDELLAVGGRELEDALDLTVALGWAEESETTFEFSRGGDRFSVTLPVSGPDELGLALEEPPTKTCGNACVFCFVDQLPGGLRHSLYVKDEDYRLSFSYGNYITLTNLSDSDYDRIAELRLSPLYVSVHATDDEVRRAMLGVHETPPVMDALRRLDNAGVRVHTQVVLVPGMNDGTVLDRTLADLFELGEIVESVAVVPVGLTAHRDSLPKIAPVDREGAESALGAVAEWQRRFTDAGRGRTVHAADELYLLAERELPPYEDYGELPQLENGVGLLRSFEHDLREAAGELGEALPSPLSVVIVTGELAATFIENVVESALGEVAGLTLDVVASPNSLFGPTVTVAGLLSGADLVTALRGAPDSDLCLVPAAAFNVDGVTLDGMTVERLGERSGRRRVLATNDVVGAIKAERGWNAADARRRR